jgi:4'-phosphopantetheinyl transferase
MTANPEIDVVVMSLAAPAERVRMATAVLSADERARVGRFIHDCNRRRFVMARARLRELLGERLEVPAQSVSFDYGPAGKPALPGQPNLRFNLSHSAELAVYVFAMGIDVGVDVEQVRVIDDADRLAARTFSPREQHAYRSLPPHQQPLAFFNCWTRKEAFVKATGHGLSPPLDSFDVSLAPGETAEILRVGEKCGADCGWHLRSLVPAPGFVAAVVSERPS